MGIRVRKRVIVSVALVDGNNNAPEELIMVVNKVGKEEVGDLPFFCFLFPLFTMLIW